MGPEDAAGKTLNDEKKTSKPESEYVFLDFTTIEMLANVRFVAFLM
jgi:hypothetical protein